MKWSHADQLLLEAVREDLPAILEEARLSLEASKAEDIGSASVRLTETTPFTFNVGHKAEKESFSMTQHNSFIDDLNKKISEGKRIAQIVHPLAQDSVRAAMQEDTDDRIEKTIAERAATAAKLPEVLQKCRDIGDGLTFRESDADFRNRWNEGLRMSEQREQDRQTARDIAATIASLGL
ncbi:MAG TPA: hypothetical protein VLI39_14290 [Sedimentisphaerales bacterium]|nr:hypothetical protein [Sedimentisphaerales bacterium]